MTPAQNPGYNSNRRNNGYVSVNNPNTPKIFTGYRRNTVDSPNTNNNDNGTRTVIIGGEKFEIPEQLF